MPDVDIYQEGSRPDRALLRAGGIDAFMGRDTVVIRTSLKATFERVGSRPKPQTGLRG
jgi:hypothetical protein